MKTNLKRLRQVIKSLIVFGMILVISCSKQKTVEDTISGRVERIYIGYTMSMLMIKGKCYDCEVKDLLLLQPGDSIIYQLHGDSYVDVIRVIDPVQKDSTRCRD